MLVYEAKLQSQKKILRRVSNILYKKNMLGKPQRLKLAVLELSKFQLYNTEYKKLQSFFGAAAPQLN